MEVDWCERTNTYWNACERRRSQSRGPLDWRSCWRRTCSSQRCAAHAKRHCNPPGRWACRRKTSKKGGHEKNTYKHRGRQSKAPIMEISAGKSIVLHSQRTSVEQIATTLLIRTVCLCEHRLLAAGRSLFIRLTNWLSIYSFMASWRKFMGKGWVLTRSKTIEKIRDRVESKCQRLQQRPELWRPPFDGLEPAKKKGTSHKCYAQWS